MQRSKNDVWVGLFVLIGGAAIVFLALQAANLLNLSFQSTYRVEARFDNIGGLKPKSPVKSGGVVVITSPAARLASSAPASMPTY